MNPLPYIRPLLVCVLLMTGCVRLPDLSLARRAAAAGDRETARWHLEELAARGYAVAWTDLGDMAREHDARRAAYCYRQALAGDPRAPLRLGRLLAENRGLDPDGFDTVRQRLLAAVGRGDDRAYRTLIRMYAAHPDLAGRTDVDQAITAARAGGVAAAEYGLVLWYQGLGTSGGHLEEIEAVCGRNLDRIPSCNTDLARAYILSGRRQALERLWRDVAHRYRAGRLSAEVVEAVADTLAGQDADPARVRAAMTLYQQIAGTVPRALVRQARLLLRYPFLADQGQLPALVQRISGTDPDQANLLMGRIYFEGRQVPRDPARAEQCFLAVADRLPTAAYYLGRMYARGDLGRPDHRRALTYLLAAARSGMARADLALAVMFIRGRGIRANPVYALAFASLAAGQELERAVELRDRLWQAAPPDQKRQAVFLLEQERAWRRGDHLLKLSAREVVK